MTKPKVFLNLSARAWKSIRSRHPDCAIAPGADFRYRASGLWLSGLGRIVESISKPSTEISKPPLFIVGHWRSGTTLLHELLCTIPSNAFPTTYACMNPQVFAVTQTTQLAKSDETVQRPMDSMTIGWGTPQEDEFALLLLGAISPYEHLLFPESLSDISRLSDVSALDASLREEWIRIFRAFVGHVSALNPGRRIVLKSPSHGFRIALLESIFPDAQFIRIVRRPDHVLASTVRLWRSLWTLYALSDQPCESELIRSCSTTMAAMDTAMETQLAALPATNVATVSYERLVANPLSTLRHIGETLDLTELLAMPTTLQARIDEMQLYQPKATDLTEDQRRHVAATLSSVTENYLRLHNACDW